MTAFVRVLLFRLDEFLQHRGQLRIPKNISRLRSLVVRKVYSNAGGILLQLLRSGDGVGEMIAERKAIFGHLDNGRQNLGKTPGTPAIEQQKPCIDCARHGPRQQAIAVGELAALVLVVPFDCREFGRGSFGVHRPHFLRLRIVNQNHRVAPHAVVSCIHEPEDRLPRDDRVKRVSPGLQDAFRRERRLGLHGADRLKAPANHRAHRGRTRFSSVEGLPSGQGGEQGQPAQKRSWEFHTK